PSHGRSRRSARRPGARPASGTGAQRARGRGPAGAGQGAGRADRQPRRGRRGVAGRRAAGPGRTVVAGLVFHRRPARRERDRAGHAARARRAGALPGGHSGDRDRGGLGPGARRAGLARGVGRGGHRRARSGPRRGLALAALRTHQRCGAGNARCKTGWVRIDLHTHATASDGTDSPAELVANAAAAGLDVVAITDHDTTAGWAEAVDALPPGLTLVRGMEMSCVGQGEDGYPVAVHLLAYLFDPSDRAFAEERERLRAERTDRLRAMAELMAYDGLPIDPEEVLASAGPSAGRPHLARALVAAGVVPSVDAAFVDLLAPHGRYYAEKAD